MQIATERSFARMEGPMPFRPRVRASSLVSRDLSLHITPNPDPVTPPAPLPSPAPVTDPLPNEVPQPTEVPPVSPPPISDPPVTSPMG